MIRTNELPLEITFNSTFEITSNNVSYFTHGFFKYPCKFIPHIPRWAILKYTKTGDLILDPFAGSGTTLVESILYNRNSIGIDFDKFSQLLCNTKTRMLSQSQITKLQKIGNKLFHSSEKKSNFKPDLHNLSHYFPQNNIQDLSNLREQIEKIKIKDEMIYNFLLVCFASVVRKCSYADDVSPKPYVSSRIMKHPAEVRETFVKTLNTYVKNIIPYQNQKTGKAVMIGDDARVIKTKKYDGKVTLAITSPPYINAFDYVRSLRLENAWLDYYGDTKIIDIKKKQIGTEYISIKEFSNIPQIKNLKLSRIITRIGKTDKKRALVVWKFFYDMEKNIQEVRRLLLKNGHYVIIIGNSRIRGQNIPTHEILIDIAKENGFDLENLFSYIIKNRYIRIPRSGKGGLIKKDWVIDLVKKHG